MAVQVAPEQSGRPRAASVEAPCRSPRLASARWPLFALAWLLAAVAGMALVGRYEFSPGASGQPTARWPEAAGLPRTAGRHTLVLFCHPQCP